MQDFDEGTVVNVHLQVLSNHKWTVISNRDNVVQLKCPDVEEVLTLKIDETGLYKRFPDPSPNDNKHFRVETC